MGAKGTEWIWGALKAYDMQHVLSVCRMTMQAAAERSEAAGELGDKAAALKSNMKDYLDTARSLKK